jgi:hypothetical protein
MVQSGPLRMGRPTPTWMYDYFLGGYFLNPPVNVDLSRRRGVRLSACDRRPRGA